MPPVLCGAAQREVGGSNEEGMQGGLEEEEEEEQGQGTVSELLLGARLKMHIVYE